MAGEAVTVAELVAQAKHHGATFTVDGEHIEIAAPLPLPTELVEVLRQHKRELRALLVHLQKYPGDGPPGDVELREIEDRVYADGFVLLWSTVLQDLVAFYRDENDKARIPPGFVPYGLQELERLFGDGTEVAASTLRLIHQAKKLGGGAVISAEGEP